MTPFQPSGWGAVAAYKVIKVTADQALSTNPKLKSFDNYIMATVDNKIFTGNSVNGNKPMVGAIGLLAAPSADWFPSSTVAGSAVGTGSLLKSSTGFCLLTSTAPGSGTPFYFNLDYLIPAEIIPSDSMDHVLAVEYQYTGATPALSWHGNSGTEGSPVWTSLLSSRKGSAPISGQTEIRFCSAGEGYDGTNSFLINIPASGQERPGELWIKDIS
jgi:hypothetical protein